MKRVLVCALAVWLCFLCACTKTPNTVATTATNQTTVTTAVTVNTTVTEAENVTTKNTTDATVETVATTESTTATVATTKVAASSTTRRTKVITVPSRKTTTTNATTKTTTTTKTTVATTAKPQTTPLRVLSIGNSFSQDAHKYLAKIAEAEGKQFTLVNLYSAGCNLKKHYENWETNTGIYDYESNGVKIASDVTLDTVLESHTFDVVTLQQASYTSVNYKNYQPYLENLIRLVRKRQPQAKIYLHQTWAYGDAHDNHQKYASTTGGSMAAMWKLVENAYNQAASDTGLSLIPCGLAIQNAQTELNKGAYSETSIQRDGAHVSYTWGRYLLARVWYQALTGDIPTVTLDQINTSVTADAAMETLVAKAAAAAFAAYPADPII